MFDTFTQEQKLDSLCLQSGTLFEGGVTFTATTLLQDCHGNHPTTAHPSLLQPSNFQIMRSFI